MAPFMSLSARVQPQCRHILHSTWLLDLCACSNRTDRAWHAWKRPYGDEGQLWQDLFRKWTTKCTVYQAAEIQGREKSKSEALKEARDSSVYIFNAMYLPGVTRFDPGGRDVDFCCATNHVIISATTWTVLPTVDMLSIYCNLGNFSFHSLLCIICPLHVHSHGISKIIHTPKLHTHPRDSLHVLAQARTTMIYIH